MQTIRVSGLSELRAALKRVDAEAPKELAKTNHEVGQIVVDKAKELAPSGPHQGGGSITPIAASIHANQAGTKVVVIAGGARSPHATVYEFGGRIRRHGGGFTRIAKRAYLYPAVEQKQQEIREKYLGMIDNLVERFRA